MKSTARAVVIGGGVVGVSTLYHLAKLGWSDSVLIERKELTSGSTWHAAGLLPLFNLSYSVGQMHKYSVGLYSELEAETGQAVGFHQVSNIRLACTQDRMDEYRYYAGVAKTLGVQVDFLTPAELKEIWPLCDVTGVIGAIRHPQDGYIQPADLTMALAIGARALGASIHRQTEGHRHLRAGRRRLGGPHRPGRHRLRARGLGQRQLRAAHRRHGRARRAGHPGRAPVHRHRGPPRDPGAQGRGPAGDGRAARVRRLLVHARGGRRPAARSLRGQARPPVTSTVPIPDRSTNCSRRISTGSARTSTRPSPASRPSAKSASSGSTTAPSPTRRTAVPSSDRPGG